MGGAVAPMPLETLLRVVEAELAQLGRLAETVQTVLAAALPNVANNPSLHRDAQAIDLMTQRLHGLSDFIGALCPSLPSAWSVDPREAVAAVKLSDLARRLGGLHHALEQEAGSFEAF